MNILRSMSVELTLTITLAAQIIVLIVQNPSRLRTRCVSLISFAGCLFALFCLSGLYGISNNSVNLLRGAYKLTSLSIVLKSLFLGAAIIFIPLTHRFGAGRAEWWGEFFVFLILSLIGACFTASSGDLVTLIVSVELATVPIYVMASYTKSQFSIEAGVKYLIMAGFSAALFGFGIALLYGSFGTVSFAEITGLISRKTSELPLTVLVGFLLLIAGIGFKIACFPFQLWAPDVYEGAPLPAAAFLSIISKATGFAALIHILRLVNYFSESHAYALLFSVLSAASLFYGNLGALLQTRGSIKRLLGYSSISHAGYLLVGIACANHEGLMASLYYLFVFGLANATVFYALACAINETGETINLLKGMAVRSPLIGASLLIGLLSLAGVPPLAGFFGKFLLIRAAFQSSIMWVAFLAAGFVAISLYYYLSVIRTVYSNPDQNANAIALDIQSKLILMLLSSLTIAAGIFQAPLLTLITSAF